MVREDEISLDLSTMGRIINRDDATIVEISSMKRPLENGSYGASPVKYKKRKISAIRDFPMGCGRFAPRINGIGNQHDVSNDGVVESKPLESVDHQVEGIEEPINNLEPLIKEELPKETLDETELHNLSNTEEPRTRNLVENVTDVLESATQLEHEDMPSSSGLKSPRDASEPDMLESPKISNQPQQSVPVVEAMEKRISTKYPSLKRISATRDFPPGCGRNAARVSKEELLKSIPSSKNKSLGEQKPSGEHKPLKEAIMTDAKQSPKQLQNGGDSLKRELKEKVVKSKGDITKVIAERVQVKTAASGSRLKQTNTKEVASIRPPTKSQTVGKNIEREVRNSEEKVRKEEYVKQSKDKGIKRMLPEIEDEDDIINQSQKEESIGFDPTHNRVIVQALMAAPNCPWRLGRKALSNLTTLSVRKR